MLCVVCFVSFVVVQFRLGWCDDCESEERDVILGPRGSDMPARKKRERSVQQYVRAALLRVLSLV